MTISLNIRLDEASMLRQLENRQIDFLPFELSDVQMVFDKKYSCSPDALIYLQWEGKNYSFIVEHKTRFDSLQIVQIAITQARRYATSTQNYPMVYLPYLSPKAVSMLKDANVSGVDLCGNLFITIPGKVYIERIGKTNRFPSSAPIKNIYQNNSSLVARLFLLQPYFDSIMAIVREIKRRNGNLTQATVSKICKSLEADIIIGRTEARKRKETYLIQPEPLLENLSQRYASPTVRRHSTVKLRMSLDDLSDRFARWCRSTGEKIVRTGTVSCTMYTVMAREEMSAFYCSNVKWLLSDMNGMIEETNRFADIELIETDEPFVYFDQRDKLYSSPVQSYLELMQGDKRDRQAAHIIAQNLLTQIRLALKNREDN